MKISQDVNLKFYIKLAAVIYLCGLIAIGITLRAGWKLSTEAETQTAAKLLRGQLTGLAAAFEGEADSLKLQSIQIFRGQEAKSIKKESSWGAFSNLVAFNVEGSGTSLRWNKAKTTQDSVSTVTAAKLVRDFLSQQKWTTDLRVVDLDAKRSKVALITSVQITAGSQENQKVVLVGFIDPTFFQASLDQHKGLIETVAWVDGTGRTIAHSKKEYVGRTIVLPTEIKIEANDKNDRAVVGAMVMNGSSGRVFVKSDLNAFTSSGLLTILQSGLLATGLLIVGLAAALVLLRRRDQEAYLYRDVADFIKPVSTPAPKIHMPEVQKTCIDEPAKDRITLISEMTEGFVRELRPHLTAILGHAQLAKARPGEDVSRYYAAIEAETREAREALEKLTYFSQAGSTHAKYRDESVRLNEVADLALRPLNPIIEKLGLKLEKNIPVELCVRGIPAQIEQMLAEVFKNAVEASKPGGRIEVTARSVEKGIEIRVQDFGSGFDQKALKHLYEPFVSSKTREQAVHKGLGLSLAYGIVKSHDGNIRVESEVGSGSTITITLVSAPQDSKLLAREKNKAQQLRNDDTPLPVEVLRVPAKQELATPADELPLVLPAVPAPMLPSMRASEFPPVPDEAKLSGVKARLHADIKTALAGKLDELQGHDFVEEKIEQKLHTQSKKSSVDDFEFSIRKPLSRIEG